MTTKERVEKIIDEARQHLSNDPDWYIDEIDKIYQERIGRMREALDMIWSLCMSPDTPPEKQVDVIKYLVSKALKD